MPTGSRLRRDPATFSASRFRRDPATFLASRLRRARAGLAEVSANSGSLLFAPARFAAAPLAAVFGVRFVAMGSSSIVAFDKLLLSARKRDARWCGSSLQILQLVLHIL